MALFASGGVDGFFHLTDGTAPVETYDYAHDSTIFHTKGGHIDVDNYTSEVDTSGTDGYWTTALSTDTVARLNSEEFYFFVLEFYISDDVRKSIPLVGALTFAINGTTFYQMYTSSSNYAKYWFTAGTSMSKIINTNNTDITNLTIDPGVDLLNVTFSKVYLHTALINIEHDSTINLATRRTSSYVEISDVDFFIGNNDDVTTFKCNGVDMQKKMFLTPANNLTGVGLNNRDLMCTIHDNSGTIYGINKTNGTAVNNFDGNECGMQLCNTWNMHHSKANDFGFGLSSNSISLASTVNSIEEYIVIGGNASTNTIIPNMYTYKVPGFEQDYPQGTTTQPLLIDAKPYGPNSSAIVKGSSHCTAIVMIAYDSLSNTDRIDYTVLVPLTSTSNKVKIFEGLDNAEMNIYFTYDDSNGFLFSSDIMITVHNSLETTFRVASLSYSFLIIGGVVYDHKKIILPSSSVTKNGGHNQDTFHDPTTGCGVIDTDYTDALEIIFQNYYDASIYPWFYSTTYRDYSLTTTTNVDSFSAFQFIAPMDLDITYWFYPDVHVLTRSTHTHVCFGIYVNGILKVNTFEHVLSVLKVSANDVVTMVYSQEANTDENILKVYFVPS